MSWRPAWLDLCLATLLVLAALPPRLEAADAYSAATAAQGANALQSEERLYNRYAVPWAKGEGTWPREKEFPWHPLGSFTHRPPAYALFLGLIYRLTGSENFAAVRDVQAWVDTLTVLLVYAAGVLAFGGGTLGMRTTVSLPSAAGPLAGRAVGFAAALVIAGYDFLEQLTTRILSETLFTFLAMTFVVAALASTRANLSWRARALITLLAGYVLGWANLTRPFLLPAALVFPLWVALAPWQGPSQGNGAGGTGDGREHRARHASIGQRLFPIRRRAAFGLAAALGLVMAILPVTWRNWQFHHELILISTNSGFTLFNSVLGTPGLSHPEALGSEKDVDAMNLGELAEQAEYKRRALDYLRRYPEDWPKIFGEKLRTLVASGEGHKISHVLLATPNDAWIYPLVLVGALISLVLVPQTAWHPRLLLVIVAASQYATSLLAKAELRYRVPIVPLLALATAWALWVAVWWIGRWARGRRPSAGRSAP